MTKNCDSLVQALEAKSKVLEEGQEKLVKSDEDIRGMSDKLVTWEGKIETVVSEIDELSKAKVMELEKFRNLMDCKSVENQEKMKAIEMEKSSLKDELSVLEASLATVEIQIKTAMAKRKTDRELISEKEELKKCIDENKAKVDSIKDKLERASKEHHDLEIEVNRLNSKMKKDVESSSDESLFSNKKIAKTPFSGKSRPIPSSSGSKRKISSLLNESKQVEGKLSPTMESHSQPKYATPSTRHTMGEKPSMSNLESNSKIMSSARNSSSSYNNSKSNRSVAGPEKKTVRFEDIMDVSSESES